MAKYYDIWDSRDGVVGDYGDDVPPEEQIVYAGYTYESYSGDAIVVFVSDGKWYENHDGHCSCYGLENWSPEETTPEAILMRPREDWPGLREAVELFLAAGAVDPSAADSGKPTPREGE